MFQKVNVNGKVHYTIVDLEKYEVRMESALLKHLERRILSSSLDQENNENLVKKVDFEAMSVVPTG